MHVSIIDLENRCFRWASAGHDPAIVFRPSDDSFRELEGGDLPLGVVPDTEYEEYRSNSLAPGDIVILGTDGIWETMNQGGELFGKDRLRDLMREHSNEPVAEIAAALERTLDAYRGACTQMDDITFVVIRLK